MRAIAEGNMKVVGRPNARKIFSSTGNLNNDKMTMFVSVFTRTCRLEYFEGMRRI